MTDACLSGVEWPVAGAGRLGLPPQPGLALLRLATGDAYAAAVAVRTAVREAPDLPTRLRLLVALVEIALARPALDEAHEAARELAAVTDRMDMRCGGPGGGVPAHAWRPVLGRRREDGAGGRGGRGRAAAGLRRARPPTVRALHEWVGLLQWALILVWLGGTGSLGARLLGYRRGPVPAAVVRAARSRQQPSDRRSATKTGCTRRGTCNP